jgi:hypothetical protein
MLPAHALLLGLFWGPFVKMRQETCRLCATVCQRLYIQLNGAARHPQPVLPQFGPDEGGLSVEEFQSGAAAYAAELHVVAEEMPKVGGWVLPLWAVLQCVSCVGWVGGWV